MGVGSGWQDALVPAGRAVLFRLATSSQLERAVRALPGGEQRAWNAASRYVAGSTLGDARATVQRMAGHGVHSSIDQFGEMVQDAATADRVATDYLKLADQLTTLPETTWLSVDSSHLGLDVDPQRCLEHLAAIASALPAGRRIQVGAEDYDRTDRVLDCVLAVAGRGLADRLGATVQANFRRSSWDLDQLVSAGVHVRYPEGMSEPREIELVFAPEQEGGYHVYAPDLPGLHTQGDTLEEAIEHGQEALELYVEGLREEGRPFETGVLRRKFPLPA